MTVSELIELLQKQEGEKEVCVVDSDGYYYTAGKPFPSSESLREPKEGYTLIPIDTTS